jgi:hypothetical protein
MVCLFITSHVRVQKRMRITPTLPSRAEGTSSGGNFHLSGQNYRRCIVDCQCNSGSRQYLLLRACWPVVPGALRRFIPGGFTSSRRRTPCRFFLEVKKEAWPDRDAATICRDWGE